MNKEALRAIKFTLFSISAGIIQAVSFTLLNELAKLPYWPCYLISLVLSVVWNFTFNRRYTFQSAGNVPKAMALVAAFYAVFTPLSTIGGDALAGIGWNEYLVAGLSMLLNFVTEYLYDKFVVFRNDTDTNAAAKGKNNQQ
jgi:putative flippase GtrA